MSADEYIQFETMIYNLKIILLIIEYAIKHNIHMEKINRKLRIIVKWGLVGGGI